MFVLVGSKKVNNSKSTVITVMVITTITDTRVTKTKILIYFIARVLFIFIY